jgi:hypothetical protein
MPIRLARLRALKEILTFMIPCMINFVGILDII